MKRIKVLLGLGMILLLTGCGSDSYEFFVTFDNVEGLEKSSEVIANGIEVGEVADMELIREGVLVRLKIDNKYKITKDSALKLVGTGLISAKRRIEITQGKAGFVKAGDTLTGEKEKAAKDGKLDSLATSFIKAIERTSAKEKEETND